MEQEGYYDIEDLLAEIEANIHAEEDFEESEEVVQEEIDNLTRSIEDAMINKKYKDAFQYSQTALKKIHAFTMKNPEFAEDMKYYKKIAEQNITKARLLWEFTEPDSEKQVLDIEEAVSKEQYEMAAHLIYQMKKYHQPKVE